MKIPYKHGNPNAGILNYEIAHNGIILEFEDRKHRYLYTAEKPGPHHLQEMLRLAFEGRGLTTYVNQHVRENYVAILDP
jgi:hypothetical protein